MAITPCFYVADGKFFRLLQNRISREIICIILTVRACFHSNNTDMRPSIAVEESLAALGHNIKMARLKRRLPQAVLAERSGVGLSTLAKIERGDTGVAIGTVAAVLQALGLGTPFAEIGASDPLAQALDPADTVDLLYNLGYRGRYQRTPVAVGLHPPAYLGTGVD